jgi:hypothetical protein
MLPIFNPVATTTSTTYKTNIYKCSNLILYLPNFRLIFNSETYSVNIRIIPAVWKIDIARRVYTTRVNQSQVVKDAKIGDFIGLKVPPRPSDLRSAVAQINRQ